MSARRLLGAALFFALVALAIAFVVLTRRAPEPGGAARMDEPVAAPSAPSAPVVVAPEAPRADVEPTPGEVGEEPGEQPGEVELPRTKVWLVGAVDSRSASVDQLALLALPLRGPQSRSSGLGRAVSAKAKADGTFRFDVSRAFAVGAPFPKSLLVQATPPDGPSGEVEVAVDFTSKDLEREGERELLCRIELPDICRVVGRAWLEDDAEKSVQVAAFELVDGRPAGKPSALGNSGVRTHEFQLLLDCRREYVVVACHEGYRPGTLRVLPSAGAALDDLVLLPGKTIAGSAWFGGGPLVGQVAATLADRPVDAPTVTAFNSTFAWTGDSLEWSEVRTAIAADGRFELRGLAAAAYELGLQPRGATWKSDGAKRRVTAPAKDVRFEPDVAEARVEVRRGDLGLPRVLVSMRRKLADGTVESTSDRTNAAGLVVFWVEPFATLEVTLGDETSLDTHTVGCGAAGSSVTLVLER